MPPLPSAVEAACFRIVQEALTNAERHASARELHVRLTAGLGAIELAVTDDGKGFDVVIAHDQPAVRTGGIAKLTAPWVTITKPHVEQRRKAIPLLKPSGSVVTCSHLVLVSLSVMRSSLFMGIG